MSLLFANHLEDQKKDQSFAQGHTRSEIQWDDQDVGQGPKSSCLGGENGDEKRNERLVLRWSGLLSQ